MSTSNLPRSTERTELLVDLLDVRPGAETDTFVAGNYPHLSPRIFGGQVLAQSLVAAGRTVPEGRTAHSLHAYFLRPGDLAQPIDFSVDRLRDGRSFSARRVQALQSGETILSMIASFEVPGDGPEHCDPMPEVPAADSLPSLADTWGAVDHHLARFWAYEQPLDIRYVSPSIFVQPQDPPGRHVQAWWRIADALGDDPLLHAAAAVYASDYAILEPVLRGHGRAWIDTGFRMASIDHAMWFHRPLRSDDWVLLEAESPSAASSRGLCTGRMFSADGRLVVSIAQEGLFRQKPPAQA